MSTKNVANPLPVVDAQIEALAVDPVAEKRLLRKIDFVLLPQCTLLFLLNFIDRAAVGNANVAGFSRDLKLSVPKSEYNVALMIFYIFCSSFFLIFRPSSLCLLLHHSHRLPGRRQSMTLSTPTDIPSFQTSSARFPPTSSSRRSVACGWRSCALLSASLPSDPLSSTTSANSSPSA
jgi:hypothetical protein